MRVHKRTRNQLIAAAAVVLIAWAAIASLLPGNSASGNGHILEPASPRTDAATGLSAEAEQDRYEAYMTRHAQQARPSIRIVIEAETFAATDGMEAEVLQQFEGATGPVVRTAESGAIHWDIDVPEDGLYNIGLRYYPEPGSSSPIERELTIDGQLPFEEAGRLVFSRVWRNEADTIERDARGNERRPAQVEQPQWQDVVLRDADGYYDEPFLFYLTKGSHRITLQSLREPLTVDYLLLYQEDAVPAYAEISAAYAEAGFKTTSGVMVKVQGEDAALKSNPSLYPINDRTSPATEPYHVSKIRMNAIGGVNWKTPGQWLEWEFDIPEDGLYQFGVRYMQNTVRGVNVVRKMYIDGKVPFKEAEAVPFRYGGEWQLGMPGSGGEPYLFALTEGKHTVRLELTMGELSDTIRMVRSSIRRLNELYLKIVMITGSVPDPYRDYQLDSQIPDMERIFREESEALNRAADRMDEMVGGTSSSTTILRTTAYQLADLGDRSETIASRLKQFKDNVSSLGTWLLSVNEQPLTIDYLFFKSPDVAMPRANAGFLGEMWHETMAFLKSFTEDYNAVDSGEGGGQAVTVWIGSGRDQAQLLRSMIDSMFTPETGIEIDLQLVNPAVVMPATLAGKGPDVALSMPDIINFAMRGAVQDLTAFPDFGEVRSQFMDSAFTGFTYRNGIYALPETQSFPMLFYRKDILDNLGLEVPDTWEDMYRIIPELQKNNMELALPFTIVFETMLYQAGGAYYQGDGIATDLDSPVGIETFRKWTELYTNYKLPLEFDFINRFRTGEMPIGIADYTTYNFLKIFAPEIRGQWDFTPLPGTKQADGTIRRDALTTATGTVIFNNSNRKEAAWTFLKWWTGAEAQATFGREMEAILGESARYAAANLEALRMLPWSSREYRSLMDQFEWIRGRPAVPGGYSLDRHLNNAFYEVYNDGSEPRETLENYVRTINEEITIKRKEFNLPTK